jgi:hypothetical protein
VLKVPPSVIMIPHIRPIDCIPASKFYCLISCALWAVCGRQVAFVAICDISFGSWI